MIFEVTVDAGKRGIWRPVSMARRMLVCLSAPPTPVRGDVRQRIPGGLRNSTPPAQVAGGPPWARAMFDDCCANKKVWRTRVCLILVLLVGVLLTAALQSGSTASNGPQPEGAAAASR